MAKDRARHPNRVINLGIGRLGGGGELKEPKKHVQIIEKEDPTEWAHRKYGAEIAEAKERAAEREAEHEADKEKNG